MAVLASCLLVSFLRHQFLPLQFRLALILMAAAAGFAPTFAASVLAAAAPVGGLLTTLTGQPRPLKLSEALVLAFLAGWSARHALGKRPLRLVGLATPIGLFAAVVAGSCAVILASMVSGVGVSTTLAMLWELVTWSYLVGSDRFPEVYAALLLLEGLGLVIAIGTLADRHPQLPVRLMRVSAVTACAVAAMGVFQIGARLFDAPGSELLPRLGLNVADFNAAGSYLLLMLPIVYVETRSRSRALAVAASGTVLTGIIMTASRAAMVPALVMGLLPRLAAVSMPKNRIRRAAVASITVAAVLVLVLAITSRLAVSPATDAMRTRIEFLQTSARMIARHPVFGIGIGQYYRSSGAYMPERLRADYRLENAHNNFLQIGAELGLVGLAAFLWLIARALVPRVRSASVPTAAGRRSTAILLGIGGFFFTCLVGHPLLVPEVAFQFWILIGVAAGLRPAGSRPGSANQSI